MKSKSVIFPCDTPVLVQPNCCLMEMRNHTHAIPSKTEKSETTVDGAGETGEAHANTNTFLLCLHRTLKARCIILYSNM